MGQSQRKKRRKEILLTQRDRAMKEAAYDPQPAKWLKPIFVKMSKKKEGKETVSDQAFYRRLQILRKAGHLHIVGKVSNGDGRRFELLCSQKFKADNAEHEFSLTRLLRAWDVRGLRGKDVDHILLPDATIADILQIEMDMGQVPLPRVETRLRKYSECDDTVIFVTTTEKRKTAVLKRCSFLSGALLVCTFADALQDKREVILTDVENDTTVFSRVLSKVLNTQQADFA